MAFPLEAIVTVLPDQVGPKIKEYVRTIHERYVVIVVNEIIGLTPILQKGSIQNGTNNFQRYLLVKFLAKQFLYISGVDKRWQVCICKALNCISRGHGGGGWIVFNEID